MNVDYYYTYSNRSSSKVSNKGIPERRLKKKKKKANPDFTSRFWSKVDAVTQHTKQIL